MPLISSDHSLNSLRTLKRTRETPSSCPYIENFGKYIREKYEMDNRIFERRMSRLADNEREKREIDSMSSRQLHSAFSRMCGEPTHFNTSVLSIRGF